MLQIQGMMDYNKNYTEHKFTINNIDLETNWKIGLIVGPSGGGKTTLAKKLFKNYMYGRIHKRG